ncbi:unnamed protein product [Closterium sp. Naga37s-1]|nr:unnamed protein product [Closterium sp. Naga37s-1]
MRPSHSYKPFPMPHRRCPLLPSPRPPVAASPSCRRACFGAACASRCRDAPPARPAAASSPPTLPAAETAPSPPADSAASAPPLPPLPTPFPVPLRPSSPRPACRRRPSFRRRSHFPAASTFPPPQRACSRRSQNRRRGPSAVACALRHRGLLAAAAPDFATASPSRRRTFAQPPAPLSPPLPAP